MTDGAVMERYQRDLRERGFDTDPAQTEVVTALDELVTRLCRQSAAGPLQKLRRRVRGAGRSRQPVKGLYLWGGVGRGKTYLMDLFFEALPFGQKRRGHFHQFIQDIHDDLGAMKNSRDPLRLIARKVATNTRVLCFDEFFVADIGDAMILGNLLAALFENGVTLVATSNVAPTDLYRGGLQRQRFLPAIDLLQRHTAVMHIGEGADYRLRVLEAAEIYHHPLDDAAEQNLRRCFTDLAPDRPRSGMTLHVAGRPISTRHSADGVVWFDFDELCTAPRSASDYLEIARISHTVLISGLPQLDESRDDDARRFISLVDVFYDRRVKLIMSATVAMDQLYTGSRLAFEFQRTRSRLSEMQRSDYLAEAHLP